jgi:hypothetical protein
MAAKAWRGCLEPDDAAFFSLTQGDQAVWAEKLCWNSWAFGAANAGHQELKAVRRLSTCRLLWRFACAKRAGEFLILGLIVRVS